MTFISITRLRVRSYFYLPAFIWRAGQSMTQTEHAAGFIQGRVMREASNAFWTVTAWENDAAMTAYRGSGVHKIVMPKLIEWCDEASVAHWTQATAELPSWAEAHRRMVAEGRLSKVKHPSAAQLANHIAEPRPGRITRELSPAKPR
jgi:heme-degrading monooxygenase HmoA